MYIPQFHWVVSISGWAFSINLPLALDNMHSEIMIEAFKITSGKGFQCHSNHSAQLSSRENSIFSLIDDHACTMVAWSKKNFFCCFFLHLHVHWHPDSEPPDSEPPNLVAVALTVANTQNLIAWEMYQFFPPNFYERHVVPDRDHIYWMLPCSCALFRTIELRWSYLWTIRLETVLK